MYDLSKKVLGLYDEFKHIPQDELTEWQEVIVSLVDMKTLQANKETCCKVFHEFTEEYNKEIQVKKDRLILYINDYILLGHDFEYETEEVEQWNNPVDQVCEGYWTTIVSFTLNGISNDELCVDVEEIPCINSIEEQLNK